MGSWSANTWLIIVNSAIYAIQALHMIPNIKGPGVLAVFHTPSIDAVTWFGHFSTAEALFYKAGNTMYVNLEVWRFITFQFLHANLLHVFFNMFGLYIFGGMVEQYLGRRRYLAFYLLCGIFGGLMYVLLNLLGQTGMHIPGVLVNDPRTPLIGASAGVFGVIMACAYIAPNARLMLLFPPIPMRLKVFAYAYVAFTAFNLLVGGHNAGGDAAHIGGAIAGAYFIRNAHMLYEFFNVFSKGRPPPGNPRRAAPHKHKSKRNTAEIDRVLAKIATQGLASLTDKEKQILRQETDQRQHTP